MSDHVISDAVTQSFICQHCGATQAFPTMPIDVLKFTRIGKKFIKKHQNCKPK